MSTFAVAGPFTKADYRDNPNFLGEWVDSTQVTERRLKITTVDGGSKYKVALKLTNLNTGQTNGFEPRFTGYLDGNQLRVSGRGSTNSFKILKDGRLTDNDVYFMRKVK